MANTGTAVFRVKQAGARLAGDKMSRAAREMRSLIIAELRDNADDLKEPFEHYALYDEEERDPYHMRDHITVAISSGGTIEANVKVRAVSPSNGFDYLDVTRFGRGPIVPLKGKVLKFPYQGRTVYTNFVDAWSPGGDWVEDAAPEAAVIAGEIADRVGRTIYTRLL